MGSLLSKLLHLDEEYIVHLGGVVQPGTIYAKMSGEELWPREQLTARVRSILQLKYVPSEKVALAFADECLLEEVFGNEDDFGPQLFRLVAWNQSRQWNLDELTNEDDVRWRALETTTILTRMRMGRFKSQPSLNLELFRRNPFMCSLVAPMVIKIPVISVRYFLELNTPFAMNSIRRSKHPEADHIISYLYEVQFLQQKTAIALHEFLEVAAFTGANKNQAQLINAEVKAILWADQLFAYLKATIEKTVVLLGAVFEISKIEDKKSHKAKLRALDQGVPKPAADIPYYKFIREFISSDSLNELNNFRSGLLHKKGISDLQPHNYVGMDPMKLPLLKLFSVLSEQHAKNTAVLIGTLAMLTDDLVRRDPPTEPVDEILELFKSLGKPLRLECR
jgi:hypothetical protein